MSEIVNEKRKENKRRDCQGYGRFNFLIRHDLVLLGPLHFRIAILSIFGEQPIQIYFYMP